MPVTPTGLKGFAFSSAAMFDVLTGDRETFSCLTPAKAEVVAEDTEVTAAADAGVVKA